MQAKQTLLLLPRSATITNIDKEIMKTEQANNQASKETEKLIALEAFELIKNCFGKIAPFWPLKNLIATNPLQGFENIALEDALTKSAAYFEQPECPEELKQINIMTIKWLQVFFDEGQASIKMPLTEQGLYAAWSQLVIYDEKLHNNKQVSIAFLKSLPKKPEDAIAICLSKLSISRNDTESFVTLLLTTLPGWASYIKYRTEWAAIKSYLNHVAQIDYIAMRLVIVTLLWPNAKSLIDWHEKTLQKSTPVDLEKIEAAEKKYQAHLLNNLSLQKEAPETNKKAQLVFCIDPRAEPFRRALESTEHYETLGVAGFFGIPIKITDAITGSSYASCPVLLTPKFEIIESGVNTETLLQQKTEYAHLAALKNIYYSLMYTFSAPFALVETLGPVTAIWMLLKNLAPVLAEKISSCLVNIIKTPHTANPLIDNIPLEEQCTYAETTLRAIGLTNNFAPLVIFCGHGSSTENNAYASALDCGACGGHPGGGSARVFAAILNSSDVKLHLAKKGIVIPATTYFIAAEHNTTTDNVVLFNTFSSPEIDKLENDLAKAAKINTQTRLNKLTSKKFSSNASSEIVCRSKDWAQVRPEWGLANNAAFIAAPRYITYNVNLDGRCFLHSYDYTQDPEEQFLTSILTAPMIVAQWINMQYLFSSINNVAYGAGSKITANITSKIGIMQGNASDLMTGFPLQSVYSDDKTPYHSPQRLIVLVYAPTSKINKVIEQQAILQKLFGNGWIKMTAIDPTTHIAYILNRTLSWEKATH